MSNSDLLSLAERVELATGPDRELDGLIGAAMGQQGKSRNIYKRGHYVGGKPVLLRTETDYPRYTASIDAAMMLVPEGWHSSVHTTEGAALRGSAAVRDRDGGPSFAAAAATPTLALVAASLRAIASEVSK